MPPTVAAEHHADDYYLYYMQPTRHSIAITYDKVTRLEWCALKKDKALATV